MTDVASTPDFRCGTVAIVGRPNAGKSTLMNQILGTKLAITSAKPQTTRHRIAGIHTDETQQIILLDTPGIHEAWTELNRSMVRRAEGALQEVDVVCLVLDMSVLAQRVQAERDVLDEAEEAVLKIVERAGRPIVLAANKIDIVPRQWLLPVIDAVSKRLNLAAVVPLSALTGDGVKLLLGELHKLIPVQPAMHPAEAYTQVSERFMVEEIIREKVFHLTEQEIPYVTTVEVRQFDESERETTDMVRIFADVMVERDTQKGILIGKRGEMLKRIGTLARKEIQEVLGCRVYLELFVKVVPDWTKSKGGLRRVGFE